MIQKIENYIMNIQKNNWGFPWHIFFANVLFHLFFPVFKYIIDFSRGEFWPYIASFLLINLIGYLNEVFKPDQDKSEFWQDIAANNIGIIIGAAQWLFIAWIITRWVLNGS
jgi:hypothetical protein